MDAPSPHPELASTLASAWYSLAGEPCAFTSLDHMPPPYPGDACVRLPVLRPDGAEAGQVVLMLGDEDAHHLGASMFGLSLDELGPAELDDANAELCNIFGSCLVKALDTTHELELGLPQRASAGHVEELRAARLPRLTLAATLGPRHVVVAYFEDDPLFPPSSKELRHG